MRSARAVTVVCASAVVVACSTQPDVHTTVYSPGGRVVEETRESGGEVIFELHRVLDGNVVQGEGMFENANEGLARQGALALAQADLAQRVQSEVRASTVVMNNADIRSVVETNVHALVRNYSIDYSGFDPGSAVYRVRISIRGEQVVREIEKRYPQ